MSKKFKAKTLVKGAIIGLCLLSMLFFFTPRLFFYTQTSGTRNNLSISIDGQTVSKEDGTSLIKTSGSEAVHNAFCYSDPQQALNSFLDSLENSDYVIAAYLYADPYPFTLSDISPENMAADAKQAYLADFLGHHCQAYGTCLPHQIDSVEKRSEDEFWYGVTFYTANGGYESPLIPDNPTTKEEKASSFGFIVKRSNGCFKSWSLPPPTP